LLHGEIALSFDGNDILERFRCDRYTIAAIVSIAVIDHSDRRARRAQSERTISEDNFWPFGQVFL
jgi:hypothetical protein